MINEQETSTAQNTDGNTDGTAYEQQTDLYKRLAEQEQNITIQTAQAEPISRENPIIEINTSLVMPSFFMTYFRSSCSNVSDAYGLSCICIRASSLVI